jgi:hypothetical protein
LFARPCGSKGRVYLCRCTPLQAPLSVTTKRSLFSLWGTCGRVDAIAYEGNRAEVVIDWKSDIYPDETDMRFHADQLKDCLRATGATRGALVYMTPGFVRWVGAPPDDVAGED